MTGPGHILAFWFEESLPRQRFAKEAAFDALIRTRFAAVHAAAARAELWGWRTTAAGRLAEIIVLDQFSRNLFRDRPAAFACDGMALALAQEAVRMGAGRALPPDRRAFLYMPYMHSESQQIHAEAVKLFSEPGLEYYLGFEQRHRQIIDRFGRYPHRNGILGRASSADEKAFLSQPGSAF